MSLPGFFLFAALVAAAAFSSGCVSSQNDLITVSAEVERRSGYSLTNTVSSEIAWPETVSLQDGLSEDEAVLLALWNNAVFQETLADLGLARADLVQARMLPNPTLSMLIPVGSKPLELTAKYPFEILWLRPKRIAAAEMDYERTVQRLVQSALDLIREVRLAFAEVSLAEERIKLAADLHSLTARIAELSQARLRAGDLSQLEAGQADADTLQIKEQLSRLGQDAAMARERLRHLLGLGFGQWTERFQPSSLPPGPVSGPDTYLTNALAARPDLRAAGIALEAAGKRIGLARAEAFTLAAGINAKKVGSGASEEFQVGPAVELVVPILNQNQGGVAQAKAKFEKAARQYATVRQRIALEVREAHARMAQAQESYDQWEQQILPLLQESVRSAEKGFATGNSTYLLVLETCRKSFDARLKAIGVAADLRRAQAELERSVGYRVLLNSNASRYSHNEKQ